MNKGLLVMLAFFLIALPAQAARVRYSGALQITAISSGCDQSYQGLRYVAQYRPAGLLQNGPNTFLSLFEQFFAHGFRRNNGRFPTNVEVPVDTDTIGDGYGPANIPAFIRITSQTVPGPAINFVQLTGTIRDFDGNAGCTVTFNAALTRRLPQ